MELEYIKTTARRMNKRLLCEQQLHCLSVLICKSNAIKFIKMKTRNIATFVESYLQTLRFDSGHKNQLFIETTLFNSCQSQAVLRVTRHSQMKTKDKPKKLNKQINKFNDEAEKKQHKIKRLIPTA